MDSCMSIYRNKWGALQLHRHGHSGFSVPRVECAWLHLGSALLSANNVQQIYSMRLPEFWGVFMCVLSSCVVRWDLPTVGRKAAECSSALFSLLHTWKCTYYCYTSCITYYFHYGMLSEVTVVVIGMQFSAIQWHPMTYVYCVCVYTTFYVIWHHVGLISMGGYSEAYIWPISLLKTFVLCCPYMYLLQIVLCVVCLYTCVNEVLYKVNGAIDISPPSLTPPSHPYPLPRSHP